MDKYKETFETWNKVASLYQDKFMDLDIYNHTYDFICSSLDKSNSKIFPALKEPPENSPVK